MSIFDTQMQRDAAPPLMVWLHLLSQQWKWEVIHTAARLHIAEELADGPRTLPELAEKTGTHAPSLYRLLRALACIGLFTELDGSRFVNTELSQLLRPEVPGSISALVTISRDLMSRPWEELIHTVRTGEPGFDKAYGMPIWRYFAEHDTAAGTLFNAAVTSFSTMVNSPIVQAADLSGVSTVVDVGGGHGSLLTALLTTHPSIEKGILFDQQHVIDEARASLGLALGERIHLEHGDFFTALPTGADVYMMKWILHDWDDEACLKLLSTCRRAMAPHSRLLVAELVLEPNLNNELAYSFDLQMLVLFGSKERTVEEFQELYDAAGLRLTRIIPTASMFSLIEGIPRSSK
jgi:O-methyltransferase